MNIFVRRMYAVNRPRDVAHVLEDAIEMNVHFSLSAGFDSTENVSRFTAELMFQEQS